jgi:hypothetical protein
MALVSSRADDALEAAFLDLRGRGFEYGGGLANHGPMAAEALARLERPEAVGPWVHVYRRKLENAPVPRARLREGEWREALGRFERVADWAALFDEELREGPWRAVVGCWSARLAGGLAAAAFHGVIRTGHAVRALEARESRPRLEELAQGLAYWAARYQALPERKCAAASGRLPSQALPDVPFLPKEQRRGGFITDGLLALEGFVPFVEVADRADTTLDPSLFLSDLTRAFAAVLRDEAHDFGRVIAFVHAVTGPAAVRLLLPHVSAETARALLRYAWQSAAAVYSAFGRSPEQAPLPAMPGIPDLVERAVANGDEHAIKLTEACLREHASRPDPVYLEAIAQTLERISSS